MKKIHKDRLLKLANHLKSGKLGHKVFDFSCVNFSSDGIYDSKGCGTCGCAIGELPFVFPRRFMFRKDCGVFILEDRIKGTLNTDGTLDFFGLCQNEAFHLFFPKYQNIVEYGGKSLNSVATKTQVAKNILAFIKKKEKA